MADYKEKNTNKPKLKLSFTTRLKLLRSDLAWRFLIHRDPINRRMIDLLDTKVSAPSTKRINGTTTTTTTTVSTTDVKVDRSRNLWFRLFVPTCTNSSNKSLPLIVFFHGGGFNVLGPDSKTPHNLCNHLAAAAHAVVASVNYRLAPEHRYPSQYDDGYDALKFIDAQYDAILPENTDIDKCFVAGDSAGGNIAHHVTLRARTNASEFTKIKIRGLVLLQPFFGGEERTESELRLRSVPMINVERTDWMWRMFLPEGADRDHPAGHVFGATEELKKVEFPRSLVMVGGYDPLQDWQKKYVEWLENCGKEVELIEYPNAFHACYYCPEVPECGMLMKDVAKFIQRL